ncbi:MAG TPA: fumarylacetoacetate hydrolase family protein, partial [Acidimicrobiales bacterium]|nr:fumarylacetoacetate hydrolase family protein [Acidimicrobiales bacterium]
MKLATIRDGDGTRAVRIDDDRAVELGVGDVRAVLERDGWQAWAAGADGPSRPVEGLDYAPLIPRPDKVLCVGLNYRSHILETGSQLPTHPTLFSKFTSALIGANDDVMLPPESEKVDWEVELAVIVGTRGRRIPVERATDHIAGYAVLNDV